MKAEEMMKVCALGMSFLPQGNITVKISKSPPGRYLYIGIQQCL
jgi:hypothetical protein